MDNKDAERDITIDRDARINVTVNRAPGAADDVIELSHVFHNMKEKSRIYAWLIVLCMLVGLCAPLLMAQLDQKPLTVSAVVSLHYKVPVVDKRQIYYVDVSDLTAPDGTELDLNGVKSSYVLSNALEASTLSEPVSVSNLRRNIRIDRMLTEDSRRQQEVASGMVSAKNAAAYEQVRGIELKYENRFIVSLTNGFGDENSQKKTYLSDGELRCLLDRVVDQYNNYLVATYAPLKLPENRVALVDPDQQDILESLDMLSSALKDLDDYGKTMSEEVLTWRSGKTGYTLAELMTAVTQLREVRVDDLYSFVRTESLAKDTATMLSGYQYRLNTVLAAKKVQEENIATTQKILDEYKNDEIYVSMQESDSSRATRTTTDYYNLLILEQAANYEALAALETSAADYEDTIASLTANAGNEEMLTAAREELISCLASARELYRKIRDHMLEVFSSSFYTGYARHTSAQGKAASVFSKAVRNMVIGAALGAVVAFAAWFIAGLAPEFRLKRERDQLRKAVAEK